jgi:ATP-binding cassette, subfamily B, bacterial MsbA
MPPSRGVKSMKYLQESYYSSSSTTIKDPSPNEKTSRRARSTLFRLLLYQKQHWPHALAVALTTAATSGFNILQPWVLGFFIVGEVITKKNLDLLPWAIALLVIAYGGREFTGYLQAYFIQTLSSKTMHKIRYDLFQHLERLPVTFFDNSRTGELVSRIISDTDEVDKVMTTGISNNGTDLTTTVGIFILLFYVNVNLALYVIPVAAALVLTVLLFRKTLKRYSRRIRQAVGDMAAKGNEVITNIRIVKSFSMEPLEAEHFLNKSLGIAQAKINLVKKSGLYSSTVDMLAGLAIVVVAFFAAPQVVHGTLTLGALVTFFGLVDKLFKPVTSLSKANIDFQRAIVAGERIFEIIDTEPEDSETYDGAIQTSPPNIKGEIKFDKVSFGYGPDRKVFENFSLVIQAGETLAIVGKSGAGKSTLVNLLLRFYKPASGEIFIDGYPITAWTLSSLREKIAVVSQDPILFSNSIRDNIAYGKPNASDAEIIEVAKAANVHDFIMSLPNNYNTKIGERGAKLSTGQRQRIAIARALLRNPSILVLDEATSNVDSQSETLIKDALKRLIGKKTTIIIAHRLSTVIGASKIIVLENGIPAEIGTHKDLLQREGIYAMLYKSQVKV